MKLEIAHTVAEALVEHLRPFCRRIEIRGSIARFKPDAGDIEILAEPDLSPVPRERLEFGKPVPRSYNTFLDRAVDLMKKDGAIRVHADGDRYKKIWLNYAGIQVDLFINIAPSDWGVQSVIRTGPEDFSHWCVTQRKYGGALPNGYYVKHQVVWIESELPKVEMPREADDAIELLTDTNHLPMPEEIDFLNFLGLGWIEPKDRVAKWTK